MTKQPNRWSINCSRNQYMLKLITLELERGSQVKLLGQILQYLHRRHSKHSEQQTSACRKYAGNINVIIGAYERDVDQGSSSGSLEFIKMNFGMGEYTELSWDIVNERQDSTTLMAKYLVYRKHLERFNIRISLSITGRKGGVTGGSCLHCVHCVGCRVSGAATHWLLGHRGQRSRGGGHGPYYRARWPQYLHSQRWSGINKCLHVYLFTVYFNSEISLRIGCV